MVTAGARGEGGVELIDELLRTDLSDVHRQRPPGTACRSAPPKTARPCCSTRSRGSLLVAGVSGGGKSTKVAGILEQLAAHGFDYLVVDPEGDYAELEEAVVLGDVDRPPRVPEALEVLERLDDGLVLNLLGVELADRPAFLARLLPELCRLRGRTGRPHWIVIDEAHHMLPAAQDAVAATLPQELRATILVTVHPDQVAADALALVRTVLAVGAEPIGTDPQASARRWAKPAAPARGRRPRARRGAVLGARQQGPAAPCPGHRAAAGTAPPYPQIRRGRTRAGPQLLLPRAGECLEPARAQSLDLRPDGRRCR